MIGGIVRGMVPGASPAQPVAWRLLRLADALEATWAGAAKVQTEAQDADGWITLGLRNDTPAADFPDAMAFRTFAILSPDGSPVDPTTLAPGRALVLALQRDTSAWPGSAAEETVAIGAVDHDGDVSDVAAGGLLTGMRTASASTSCTVITGTPTSATAQSSTGSRLIGAMYVLPSQAGAIIAAGLTEGGVGVAGDLAASFGALSGARRIVIGTGCNSTADDGPHPVRFRAWYALLAAGDYPWSDLA